MTRLKLSAWMEAAGLLFLVISLLMGALHLNNQSSRIKQFPGITYAEAEKSHELLSDSFYKLNRISYNSEANHEIDKIYGISVDAIFSLYEAAGKKNDIIYSEKKEKFLFFTPIYIGIFLILSAKALPHLRFGRSTTPSINEPDAPGLTKRSLHALDILLKLSGVIFLVLLFSILYLYFDISKYKDGPPSTAAAPPAEAPSHSADTATNQQMVCDYPIPSFDCSKAKSAAEKSICASCELRTIDNKMHHVFQKVISINLLNDYQRKDIILEQRKWIKNRDTCADNDCILNAYYRRLDHLYDLGRECL